MKNIRFFPLSENALTVSFGNEILIEFSEQVFKLDNLISRNPFPGLVETVPAYSSLTIFFDLVTVRKTFPDFPTAFEAVKFHIEKLFEKIDKISPPEKQLVEIPVSFSETDALDLPSLIESKEISKSEFIKIFTGRTYRVFMLGFLPGFAYMGETDERIAAPRKKNPRLKVPKGSVGIAGRQTGIYPFESPGGWQIIGKTTIELFTPEAENPTFLQAGDLVKFVSEQ